jgi:hypothetical protein
VTSFIDTSCVSIHLIEYQANMWYHTCYAEESQARFVE